MSYSLNIRLFQISFSAQPYVFYPSSMVRYVGHEIVSYMAEGTDPKKFDSKKNIEDIKKSSSNYTSRIGILARLTVFLIKSGVYEEVVPSKRQYNVDDVRGYTPFVTRSTWGLEKIYFRDRNTRFIAIVEGKSALTRRQVQSSFACFILGTIITFFLLAALLVC